MLVEWCPYDDGLDANQNLRPICLGDAIFVALKPEALNLSSVT